MTHPVASPVSWGHDGHPHSEQFNDVYHTTSGAVEQAQHVFLKGCGLPERWQQPEPFTILETGFGLGLNFLATWQAWLADENRCKRLHFVSVEAYPVTADDIRKATQRIPELQNLGEKLACVYPRALLPGLHRLEFSHEDGYSITLTLAIGDARKLLPQLQLEADAVYLDGFSPAKNPELWGINICALLARLAKPNAHIATWCVAGQIRRNLQAVGFTLEKVAGLPPKRECLTGIYTPQNLSRRGVSTQAGRVKNNKEVVIIGAGFAGATLAWALAKRGWQVKVMDKALHAAGGASGLPMGLGVPNVSKDDALLTQITRAGAQWLRYVVRDCGLEQQYWNDSPVEQLTETLEESAIPEAWGPLGKHLFEPKLTNEGQPCRHFHQGMRLEGPAFVNALLSSSDNITCQWNCEVKKLEQREDGLWQLFDQNGEFILTTPHVVVAAAMDSLPLLALEHPGLTPNRGQITLGKADFNTPKEFLDARTGHGHFLLPHREDADWSWSMGSTFQHDNDLKEVLQSSHDEIWEKLQKLSLHTAKQLQLQFEEKQLDAFVEIRCTSSDHLPLVGAVPDLKALELLDAQKLMNDDVPILDGLFVLTALGSRGLNAGPLCAELLASMMNHEPWPLTKAQAGALLPARFILRVKRKLISP